MKENIQLGDIEICVNRKEVKNVHLSVHPPKGRVVLVAPKAIQFEVVRAYAISKLGWIRKHKLKFEAQVRESSRQFVGRESHYLWGKRYLLRVVEQDIRPFVKLDHKYITLTVRPGSDVNKRAELMHYWHKALLHKVVPQLIKKWEPKLKVNVTSYSLQKMKTKWGSCNHQAQRIHLNTELVKKPIDLLDYVVLHEMIHLIEPTHNKRFTEILGKYYPSWYDARAELNELPLSADILRKATRNI